MADTPKSRIARFRKNLAIPRNMYLAAMERQEARAWAKWTDPAKDIEIRKKFEALRIQFAEEYGQDEGDKPLLPPVSDPDPALFDSEEDILKDDKIIAAYLADNPTEPKKPMARGITHYELLEFWKNSVDGRRYFQQRDRAISQAIEEAKAKVCGSP